jgi:hypothetical protein
MRKIAEANVLLRARLELPSGLSLATDEFQAGWEFLRKVKAVRLEKKIRAQGWNFIKIADGSLRSGVGASSQEAIASALKLALGHLSGHFNVAEVEHIELTEYPWFFLARISLTPYRLQRDAIFAVPDGAVPLPATLGEKRLPVSAAALYPHFGSAMPMLKQMLVATRSSEARQL